MFFNRAIVQIFSFGERCNVLFQLGFVSLNLAFHISPQENICTFAHIIIYYLYIIFTAVSLCEDPCAEICGRLNVLHHIPDNDRSFQL